MRKTHRLSVPFSEEAYGRLREIAEAQRPVVSMAYVAGYAVLKFLENAKVGEQLALNLVSASDGEGR